MTDLLSLFSSSDAIMAALRLADALGVLWPTVKASLAVAAFLWCFWVLYVATMGVYRLHLSGQLKALTISRFTRAMCYSLVAVAYVVDLLAQYTVATLVFLDLPRRGERLVTDRLQRYVAQPGQDWRSAKAHYVCTHLLDLFDPTGDHCNRSKA